MFNINPMAIYTITTLAKEAGVCYNTAASWVNAGIKARKIGNNTYMTGRSIIDFFESEDEKETQQLSNNLKKKLQKVL